MNIEMLPISQLTPYRNNARTHSIAQIRQIASSIQKFGFLNPILVSDEGDVLAGHGRLAAAKHLEMTQVPVVRVSHLNAVEKRAYILADNKLAQNAGWDPEILAIELQYLVDAEFEVDLTGFSMAEIDLTIDAALAASPSEPDADDIVPIASDLTVTAAGDVWLLGRHRLICGNSLDAATFETLMIGSKADLIFTDPPYNVPVHGHVSGSGKVRHREFAFASGEMSSAEFTAFLATTLGGAASFSRDGAIAFVCMDWRHMRELMSAGDLIFDGLKQMCVWNKANGGQGTFYRSKHELIFVYKIGTEPHVNNFGLGASGRYRTNVWDYAGANSISASRAADLEMHPTVKPIKMVIDAIEDCSRRGDIILDCFGGSGTTLIASEKCGRSARLIECDAIYCDVIIRRFQSLTGKAAVLRGSGLCFDELEIERLGAVQ